MSLQIQDDFAVPEQTVRVAQAAFPKGNIYMKLRDELGALYSDEEFVDLFPQRGQPAMSPGRLALVTVMQFMENLSDRQAAEAVRARIDWKYVLGLELNDSGFDDSILSEFRARLIEGGAEYQLLHRLLERAKERGWLNGRGRQRTDSTHVLASIRVLNRLELVGETLRAALNELANLAGDWLSSWAPTEWLERYAMRFDQIRLPKKDNERQALIERIGIDGHRLFSAVYADGAPMEVRQAPMVEILRQVWIQQYYLQDGQVTLRKIEDLPPAQLLIQSPYDVEARYSTHRDIAWTGYRVHMTETCDEETPNLIVHVATTPATTPDETLPNSIHQALDDKDLLPAEHLMDAGYINSEVLVSSQNKYQVEVVGPVPSDTSWQGRMKQGFDVACFQIDWDAQQVRCPQGRNSQVWSCSHTLTGQEIIHVQFSPNDCQTCVCRSQCTRAREGPRTLKLRPRAQHLALQHAREAQITNKFKHRYAKRAGIEGTISQGTRASGMRRARYIGLAKTHLQHIIIAAAINLHRLADWVNETPRATTRQSPLAVLAGG